MARKPRLHADGGFYHVILRGNGGEKIFFSNQDRTRLFLLIQEGIERFHYRLHAYCLMSNHIHLVLQVGTVPLSKIVQNLSFRYTKYINKKKSRMGHLFQGRYKAILIDADSYMLELVRYIHNNPVRSGIAQKAIDYKWSSHQPYLGLQKIPFLTTDWVLGQFAKTAATARSEFAAFVARGNGQGRRDEFYSGMHDNRILGDDRFVEKTLAVKIVTRKPSLDAVVEQVCSYGGVTEKELHSPSRQRKLAELRGLIGWLATRLEAATLSEVAKRFQRDLATISRAVRRVEERMAKPDGLITELDRHLKELIK